MIYTMIGTMRDVDEVIFEKALQEPADESCSKTKAIRKRQSVCRLQSTMIPFRPKFIQKNKRKNTRNDEQIN